MGWSARRGSRFVGGATPDLNSRRPGTHLGGFSPFSTKITENFVRSVSRLGNIDRGCSSTCSSGTKTEARACDTMTLDPSRRADILKLRVRRHQTQDDERVI